MKSNASYYSNRTNPDQIKRHLAENDEVVTEDNQNDNEPFSIDDLDLNELIADPAKP